MEFSATPLGVVRISRHLSRRGPHGCPPGRSRFQIRAQDLSDQVRRGVLILNLFVILMAVASWLTHRAWLRQQAAQENLRRLLTKVKTLSGMLPICSHCKKIRDDKGYWNQIETYLNEPTDAEFTHGICPECAKEIFPRISGKHTAI